MVHRARNAVVQSVVLPAVHVSSQNSWSVGVEQRPTSSSGREGVFEKLCVGAIHANEERTTPKRRSEEGEYKHEHYRKNINPILTVP